jgi:acetylornithine deacetylase
MLERLDRLRYGKFEINLGLVAFVEDYLKSLDVAYVKVPNSAGDKAALFATIGPERDGGVVLSGHTGCRPRRGQA